MVFNAAHFAKAKIMRVKGFITLAIGVVQLYDSSSDSWTTGADVLKIYLSLMLLLN